MHGSIDQGRRDSHVFTHLSFSLFAEEGVEVHGQMVDSDYSDEVDVLRGASDEAGRASDAVRGATGDDASTANPVWTGSKSQDDVEGELQHLYDGDLALGSHQPSGDDGERRSAHKLPSFEETPMPKKPTLAQWRKEKRRQRIRNEAPPLQLTSSLYLVPGAKNYVAACTMVRDDHDYIIEWVNHHLSLGIRPLYIYDHRSLPPLEQFLRPYIADGRVVLERYEADMDFGSSTPQLYAFDDCLRRRGDQHR